MVFIYSILPLRLPVLYLRSLYFMFFASSLCVPSSHCKSIDCEVYYRINIFNVLRFYFVEVAVSSILACNALVRLWTSFKERLLLLSPHFFFFFFVHIVKSFIHFSFSPIIVYRLRCCVCVCVYGGRPSPIPDANISFFVFRFPKNTFQVLPCVWVIQFEILISSFRIHFQRDYCPFYLTSKHIFFFSTLGHRYLFMFLEWDFIFVAVRFGSFDINAPHRALNTR